MSDFEMGCINNDGDSLAIRDDLHGMAIIEIIRKWPDTKGQDDAWIYFDKEGAIKIIKHLTAQFEMQESESKISMSDTYEPAKCKNCQHESSVFLWPPVGCTIKCSHCGHEEIVQSIIDLDNYRETLTGSSLSMGENAGWIKGPHDAVKAVQKLIIDGEGYRSDIRLLGDALQSMTLDCAAKIEESRNLKQLFIDLTFCYLNKGSITEILYRDSLKDFKEIVGDDPEFVNNGGEG